MNRNQTNRETVALYLHWGVLPIACCAISLLLILYTATLGSQHLFDDFILDSGTSKKCIRATKIGPDYITPADGLTDGISYASWTPYQRGEVITAEEILQLDLCREYAVTGVRIQADANDALRLESSRDGKEFVAVTTAGTSKGTGLQWRLINFNFPLELRFLRIRLEWGDGIGSVSELQLITPRGSWNVYGALLSYGTIAACLSALIGGLIAQLKIKLATPRLVGVMLSSLSLFLSLTCTYGVLNSAFPLLGSNASYQPMHFLGMFFLPEFVFDERTAELGKLIIAAASIPLAALYFLFHGTLSDSTTALRTWRAILLVLVILGIGNYYHFNWSFFSRKIDSVDVAHYYLGAKFFPELGFKNLYAAAILADQEQGRYFEQLRIVGFRSEQDGSMVSTQAALKNRTELLAAFTPNRWETFKHDLAYLKRAFEEPARANWKSFFDNRGYNATPFGNFVLELITNAIPIEGVKCICFLDVFLIMLGIVFVFQTFGSEVGLLTLAFLACTFSARWPTIGSSLLRTDWLMCLLVAQTLIHRGYLGRAGFLTGVAGHLRIFPLGFAFFFFVRAIVDLFLKRGFRTDAWRFIIGCGLALVGGCMPVLYTQGIEPFRGSFENLSIHQRSENLTSQRVGLGIALAYRGELTEEQSHSNGRWIEKCQLVEDLKPVRYVIAAILLTVLAFTTQRMSNFTLFGVGFVPIFLITIGSYYYFIMRLVLVPFHMLSGATKANRFCLPLLFITELACLYHLQLSNHRYSLTAILSLLLTFYCTVLVFLVKSEPNVQAESVEPR